MHIRTLCNSSPRTSVHFPLGWTSAGPTRPSTISFSYLVTDIPHGTMPWMRDSTPLCPHDTSNSNTTTTMVKTIPPQDQSFIKAQSYRPSFSGLDAAYRSKVAHPSQPFLTMVTPIRDVWMHEVRAFPQRQMWSHLRAWFGQANEGFINQVHFINFILITCLLIQSCSNIVRKITSS